MNKYEHLTKYIHLFKRHKSGQSQNYMYIFIWNTRTLLLHRPASCSVPTCRMYNRPCKKKTHANIYCLYALLKTVSFWNLTKTQNHPSKYDMQIIGTPTNILELETLGYCYDLENGLNKPVMWVTSITHLARSRTATSDFRFFDPEKMFQFNGIGFHSSCTSQPVCREGPCSGGDLGLHQYLASSAERCARTSQSKYGPRRLDDPQSAWPSSAVGSLINYELRVNWGLQHEPVAKGMYQDWRHIIDINA